MINVTDNKGRSHRTALFVDARDLDGEFEERTNRLLQSLNGNNIKVDVFAVRGGSPASGVVRVSGSPGSLSDSVAGPSSFSGSDLSAWAGERGYVQVLLSVPAGASV